MKRQGLVAIAVIVALAGVVAMLARRGGGGSSEPASTTSDTRFFVDDSLGLRLRIPDSPGWSLRPEPPGNADGGIVTAVHEGGRAVVRVIVQRVQPEETLDDVLAARKRQMARAFGVDDLDPVIAKVMRDEQHEVNGRMFRQWQAVSQPSANPEGEPETIVFMWLLTLDGSRSIECLGMIRSPVHPKPEDQHEIEGLLGDVAYILQSVELR
jgi:hypothetical protein